MEIITNKIYICLPVEKELDKLDWDGLSTEEYNGKTYYKIHSGGSSSDVVKKITFETLKDNVTVKLNIVSSSEQSFDYAYACELDGTSGYSNAKYKISGNNRSITHEYVVPTKGAHWIYIGYRKDGSGNSYNDCGYFSIDNSDKEYVIRQPKEVYLASDKMNEITYGSKKILEYGLGNTISWETLRWNKSNNSYTYNTKDRLTLYYVKQGDYVGTYAYLSESPASTPNDNKINSVIFSGSYSGNSYNFTYKLDLSDWDTSNVTDMSWMFSNCRGLTYIDLSKFNTSNVTNMSIMFLNCNSLTSLDLSGLNTSKVTDMKSMFESCKALTSLDLSGWDTSKVTNMGTMFYNCNSLTSLDLSGWDTSNVTIIGSMFYNCNSLTSLNLSGWNTSNITNMSWMFYNCNSLTSLDLSGWDTSNVTNMSNMFHDCNSLTYLDLSGFDTSNVTNMSNMFYHCRSLTYLDLSGFDTSKVTNMSNMFPACNSLTYLDLSGFDTSNVTDITFLFYGNQLLERLNLVGWNLENLKPNPLGPFWSCPKLTTLIDGHESEPDVTVLNGLKEKLDFQYCPNLNYESVYALFRGLATVTTTKTITLPKVMEGKLDATKVKIATDKGWTIEYS